jgi:hypothetical protein
MGETRSPVKFDRTQDHVLDSAINYYKDEKPKLPYEAGELFLDNGAFTANMQNTELDLQRVIQIQEKLDPSKTIPYDYPFKKGQSSSQMENRWKKTAKNIRYWHKSSSQ